jgi:hypothetical protein
MLAIENGTPVTARGRHDWELLYERANHGDSIDLRDAQQKLCPVHQSGFFPKE